jgi:2-dehydro-3-deoxygluconokinase
MSPGSVRAAGLVTIGETMGLLTATQYGPLRSAPSLGLGVAGAESNVAIGVRRLGHDATWIGRVGDDEVGDLVESTLRGEGLHLELARDTVRPTGLMLKSRRTAAITRVTYYRSGSAASALSPDDLPLELIASARILHVTGITPALSDSCREAVLHAVKHARAQGTCVSLDINYRAALWDEDVARPVLRELAELADILFAGPDEADLLLGSASGPSPASIAADLAKLGPAETVVKCGAAGAVAWADGRTVEKAAVPVHPVDPVGAGDAFVAGYLAGVLDGATHEERLELATLTGAFAVTVSGDWEGAPTRRELILLGQAEGTVVR